MKYKITKKHCMELIKHENHVCNYCGRKLRPIRTVDNSGEATYWVGCFHGKTSGNFTAGVKKEVYDLAVKLVLDDFMDFNMNYEDRQLGDFDYAFHEAVRRNCRIITSIEHMKNNKPRYTKKELKNIYFKDS